MSQRPVTLQISLSPGDLKHAPAVLPHQLRTWAGQVDEILLTLDTLPPRGTTRFGKGWTEQGPALTRLLEDQVSQHPNAHIAEVDYGQEAGRELADRFFGGRAVPEKDSRGGPFYSYFYGLAHARHDHVLHLDSDLLFGGGSQRWIGEAQDLLATHAEVLAVNPLGGPPLHDLSRWPDPPLDEHIRAFRCTSISTRVFFVDRRTLDERVFPLSLRKPRRLRSRVKAKLHGNPSVAMPEDLLTDALDTSAMFRADLLGSPPGMWSVHPLVRTPAFYATLDELVRRVEAGDVPDAQRGAFELSESFVVAAGGRAH